MNFFLNFFALFDTFQSLIVRDRCKLELWDHANDLDLGLPADLVSLLHHWDTFLEHVLGHVFGTRFWDTFWTLCGTLFGTLF